MPGSLPDLLLYGLGYFVRPFKEVFPRGHKDGFL
jgi:hypothetical protein